MVKFLPWQFISPTVLFELKIVNRRWNVWFVKTSKQCESHIVLLATKNCDMLWTTKVGETSENCCWKEIFCGHAAVCIVLHFKKSIDCKSGRKIAIVLTGRKYWCDLECVLDYSARIIADDVKRKWHPVLSNWKVKKVLVLHIKRCEVLSFPQSLVWWFQIHYSEKAIERCELNGGGQTRTLWTVKSWWFNNPFLNDSQKKNPKRKITCVHYISLTCKCIFGLEWREIATLDGCARYAGCPLIQSLCQMRKKSLVPRVALS